MNNIRNHIKSNQLQNLYLFTGPEIFLIEFYINDIIKLTLDNPKDEFNLLEISREIPDTLNVGNFVNSFPFMADKKLLIIKDSGILKKASDEQKKFWVSLLSQVPDYCTIIFYETSIDKKSVIYKAISANGYVGDFPYQKGQSLIIWIKKILATYGKEISSADCEYLIASCNEGMINIKRELEKLGCSKIESNVITKADVDRLVTKSIESKVFDMAEDIARGNNAGAFKKLIDIKSLGTKPTEITGAIFSKFSQFRKLKLLSYLPIREISARTKQRDFFIKKDLSTIKNVSIEEIERIMFLCKDVDFKVKNGFSDGWTELILMLKK